MLLIIGIMLCAVGLVMLVIFFIHANNPKITATITEINLKKFKKHEHRSKKLFAYATVSYNYRSIVYKEELLLNTKNAVGDTITISFKKDVPEKIRHYTPVKELVAISVVLVIGAGLVLTAFWLNQKFV